MFAYDGNNNRNRVHMFAARTKQHSSRPDPTQFELHGFLMNGRYKQAEEAAVSREREIERGIAEMH
jgi:hypothetical protein